MSADQSDRVDVLELARNARAASTMLTGVSFEERNIALVKIAEALKARAEEIIDANKRDLLAAEKALAGGKISQALLGRLKLDQSKLENVIDGMLQVAATSDPLGRITLARELDVGLELYRVSCPLGVIAVIFESRPDVLPQIFALSLKTANAVILKGGSEARNTNEKLFEVIRDELGKLNLPGAVISLVHSREAVEELLRAEDLIDLVIPRGSNDLVRHIQSNTRIPVLGHADGICHIYIDEDADIAVALRVTVDAKIQYPSACNAVETVLIHRSRLKDVLPALVDKLAKHGVEVRCDETCIAELENYGGQTESRKVGKAQESDWKTEYCDLIVSVAAVDSVEAAISHINTFGSGHTESIITESRETFDRFFAGVNSAGVYLNASTRFADGFRYGFGAEVGISTSRLHPRGPVGLEGLVTYKYKILGKGHIVADYSGQDARTFTHRDLL